MAKRYKEPDKLALDMMQCKADGYGCHYGHWKAAQAPVQVELEPKRKAPEEWRECPWCRKQFKPVSSRQIYCQIYCQRSANYVKRREKRNEYNRKWRAKQKEGAVDG
jgi:hypothetical protein